MVKHITIVSLSRGLLGEPFVRHELDLGLARLKAYGVEVCFSANALKGLRYLENHPEARARDLLDAFQSDTDMILCAIGGDDTYRLLPYLFDNDELKNAVTDKIFLGFSDTTANHFMLDQVGLKTFYGQAFLPDICEPDKTMLPYTRHYFEELLLTGTISKIVPSAVWYDARADFSQNALGIPMPEHPNHGFELLQGAPVFSGPILGGCIDSIYDFFNSDRHADSTKMCSRYRLFPDKDEWKGKILLLESSEEQPTPEKYHTMLTALKQTGIFGAIHGILTGKPMDEKYADDYNRLLIEVVDDRDLPIVANINVGHATPRCIAPFGVNASVDVINQQILFEKRI